MRIVGLDHTEGTLEENGMETGRGFKVGLKGNERIVLKVVPKGNERAVLKVVV